MLKVATIGGGSTYTPELVNGFIERIKSFPLDELWLMDIDPQRLEIVGGFAQRMVAEKGNPFKVILTQDQKSAIRDASYVTTQIRVGRMTARVADEYLGKRHGLIGQETTGVGGMAKALRTIPVVLSIANDVQHLANPGALLVNFTNPSGLVTEALFQHAPAVQSVGVCNVPITTKMEILNGMKEIFGESIAPERVELKTLGLNHLSWHYGFTVDGNDLWPEIMKGFVEHLKKEEEPEFDPESMEMLGMMPNYYLRYYYYTERMLKLQEKWPPSRGEEVIEIEKDLLRDYSDPRLKEPPADLLKRGGAYYSTVATQLLNAHYNNLGEIHVCNVRNHGTVQGWDPNWVLEMPCKVDREGVTPITAEPLPKACYELLAHVKAYEQLTVEGAVKGDRKALSEALMVHPLGPQADQVKVVLDDLLKINKQFLP